MIGMSQIRKRLLYGIAIGAGVGIIGIAITLVWAFNVVNSYKEGTNKDYIANYTTEVVMLNRDVIQGETITNDMLTTARVHITSVPTDLAGNGAIGMIAKYNIPANIPLVNSMFGTEIVSVDERIQEVSSVMLPTELTEGEYIDIKIKMPSGLEYIVLPQVKVERIFGTTVWLYLNDEELNLLNSAIVDTYLSDGVTLYGVKYVDQATQIKLDSDEAIDMAKLKLSKKIEDDVANGAVALTLPAEVTDGVTDENETTDNDNNKTADEDVATTDKNETEDNVEDTSADTDEEESPEYINFSNNLSDLILKYAIEYRYYVESYNKIERTYQPSEMIMEHMRNNKYITEEAKASLDADVRRQIEENLEQFQNNSGEKFEDAVSGLEKQISTQQALRNSTLSGE